MEQNLHNTLGILSRQGYKYILPSDAPSYNPGTDTQLGNSPQEQLYFLPDDPNEQHNIADRQPQTVRQLRDRLQELISMQGH